MPTLVAIVLAHGLAHRLAHGLAHRFFVRRSSFCRTSVVLSILLLSGSGVIALAELLSGTSTVIAVLLRLIRTCSRGIGRRTLGLITLRLSTVGLVLGLILADDASYTHPVILNLTHPPRNLLERPRSEL